MSVSKGKRAEGDMAVIVSVRALAKYTLTICKNEKRFPKRDRWLIVSKIVDRAISAAEHADVANDVFVHTWKDYKLRRRHQQKAIKALRQLRTLKQTAYDTLPSVRGDAHDQSDATKQANAEFEHVKVEIDQAFRDGGYAPTVTEKQCTDVNEYWTGLVIDARERMKAWRDSDAERYAYLKPTNG